MPRLTSNFPDSAWDGSTPSRQNTAQGDGILEYRRPDASDWDQAVAEIIAIENLIVDNGGLGGGGGGTTFTPVGPISLSGSNLKLNNTTYAIPKDLIFVVIGNATVTTNIIAYHPIITQAMKLTNWAIYGSIAPIGADLLIDVEFSQDQGSTWTSLWVDNPGNAPSIPNGSKFNSGALFDTTIFNIGTVFRLDITQIGSDTAGADITLVLSGLIPFPTFGGSPP